MTIYPKATVQLFSGTVQRLFRSNAHVSIPIHDVNARRWIPLFIHTLKAKTLSVDQVHEMRCGIRRRDTIHY